MLSNEALRIITVIIIVIVVIVIICMIIAGLNRRVKNGVKTDWCNAKTRAAEQDDGNGDKFFGYNLWRNTTPDSSDSPINISNSQRQNVRNENKQENRNENKQERIMVNSSKGLSINNSDINLDLIGKINLQQNQSYVETLNQQDVKNKEVKNDEMIKGPEFVSYDSFEFPNGHEIPPVKLFIQWHPIKDAISYNIYCNNEAIVTKDNYKKKWVVLSNTSYYETELLDDDHCWSIAISAITTKGESQLSKVFTNCKL
jgi:hypothetical protein